MKQTRHILCLVLLCFGFLKAQDTKYLESAFNDGLYLFVEQNAEQLLQQKAVLEQPTVVEKLNLLWVASLVKREAYELALKKIKSLVNNNSSQLGSKIKFYKAISLFYVYVKKGEPVPENEMTPHDLLVEVELDLDVADRYISKFYRAWDLFEQGEYNRSSDLLNLLSSGIMPVELAERVKFLFSRSLFYSNPPQYEKSLQILNELSSKYTKSSSMAQYHYWKAENYFEMNQLKNAEIEFKNVLKHQLDVETEIEVYHSLGWLYASMGDLEQSKKYLEMLLKPKWEMSAQRFRSSSAYKLSNIYLLLDQPASALQVIAPVLNDEVLKYHGELLTGRAYLALEAWEEAIEVLRRAVGSPVKTVRLEARRNLAKANFKLKRFQLALDGLKMLINDEVPLDFRIQIQLDLAKVYLEMGDVYVAQKIYNDLLRENSKNIEAGIHYQLSKCAQQTNPLIECVYLRDELKEKLLQNRISANNYAIEKELLVEKVGSVLSRIWNMADAEDKKEMAMREKNLPYEKSIGKKNIVFALVALTDSNLEEMLKIIKDKYFEINSQLPSKLGQESAVFNKLSEKFKEVFVDTEKIPDYKNAITILSPLSNVYLKLQVMNITSHLDHVISLGKKSPYLALAYHDKANLFQEQGLLGVALECFFYAIETTTNPKLKSDYLLKLTKIYIEVAQKLGEEDNTRSSSKGKKMVDSKTQKFKVKQALSNLDKILELDQINHAEIVMLQHQCHLIVLDFQNAEKVLTNFIQSNYPLKEVIQIEDLLINFYLDQGLKDAAASQRLIHANRLQAHDPENAHKYIYLAALQILENKKGEEKGLNLLNKLVAVQPRDHWTYKAALKQVEVFQKIGKTDAAAHLLSLIKKENNNKLPDALQYEWQMVNGRLAMQQNDFKVASEYFKQVYDQVLPQHSLKPQAMLEYAGALEYLNQSAASDIYLHFYYQFSKHEYKESALLKSCQLKLNDLNRQKISESKMVAKKQLHQLITRLDSDTDRIRLLNQVKSL